jgi:hypothetical protein
MSTQSHQQVFQKENLQMYSKNQYTLWQILGIWFMAGAPMWLLGWVVYPAMSAGIHGAGLEESLLGYRRPRLLHAGDGRSGRFCLVPELLESVRLAVLVDKHSIHNQKEKT